MSEATLPEYKLTFRQAVKSPAFVGVSSLLLVGAIIYFGFSMLTGEDESEDEKDPGPITVPVVVAKKTGEVNLDRIFSGLIRARRASQLAFERSASVTQVFFDEGDSVSKGDVLAQLDQRNLDYLKLQVKAQLANANAVLSELTNGPRKEAIDSAKAEQKARQAELDFAKQLYQRRAELNRTGSISTEEWENAESSLNIAQANYDAAERRFAELDAGTRQEKLDAQKQMVKQLEAQLLQVDLDIEKSKLFAPYDGRIASRRVDEGTIVAPGQAVMSITESSHLEAVVGVPPSTLQYLNLKQEYDCVVDGQESTATLARILPETDKTTRTVPVVFELQDKRFRPGQVVRIPISEPVEHDGFWIPTAALLPASKGLWSVFVVVEQDGKQIAQRRFVTVQLNDGGRSLINENQNSPENSLIQGTIQPGDLIISEGVQKIAIGQPVKVKQLKSK